MGQKPLAMAEEARTFQASTLGGRAFAVSVPGGSTVGDLWEECSRAGGLGALFALVPEGGPGLSAALPAGSHLSIVAEKPESTVCEAACKVLREATAGVGRGSAEELRQCCLGRCRYLGAFPTKLWTEDPRMAEFMKSHDYGFCEYEVLELTLIDGADRHHQLIGVINAGSADFNSGHWGSIYLRPSFQEVGGILSYGDTASKWDITDASWYKDPARVPPCKSKLLGGWNAETRLENHLSCALSMAYWGSVYF